MFICPPSDALLDAGIVTGRKVCYFTFGEEGLVTQGWRAYQSFIEVNTCSILGKNGILDLNAAF